MTSNPDRYSSAPMASTRQVPNLSLTTPNSGCPIPHNRFCSAMARPKVARSQPLASSIGNWKNPIAERGPNASSEMIQAQPMATAGSLCRTRWSLLIVNIDCVANRSRVYNSGLKANPLSTPKYGRLD